MDSCMNNKMTKSCKDHIPEETGKHIAQCIGQSSCTVKVSLDQLYGDNLSSAPANCKSEDAVLFIQFSCIQATEDLVQKRQEALGIACLGIFACLLYTITIYYLQENSKLQNIEWDVATVTAGDFSVELQITHEMYNIFMSDHYDRVKYESPGMALKCYIKENIEEFCI